MRLEGFAVPDAAAFAAVVEAWSPRTQRYVFGQSARRRVTGPVYTSTSYPERERIPLHGELSYRATPPRWLLLHCAVAPASGGETPLLCGAELLRALPPALVDRFVARGLSYRKVMHGGAASPGPRFGKSWQEHLETDDRSTAIQLLEEDGCAVTLTEDGGLVATATRPAVRDHPSAGRVWAGQTALWHPAGLGQRGQTLLRVLGPDRLPTHVRYGDGSEIDPEDVRLIAHTAFAAASAEPWRPGVVVLVDNWRVLHGRAPFTGPRTIHVALVDDP